MSILTLVGALALILSQNKTQFKTVAEGLKFVQSISTRNRVKGTHGGYNGIIFNNPKVGVEYYVPNAPAPIVCDIITCHFRPKCEVCKVWPF